MISDGNSSFLTWQGEKGNSKRIPLDSQSELSSALATAGVDGIEYKNGDVDFSPVSKFEISFQRGEKIYQQLLEGIEIDTLHSRSDLNDAIRKRWQSLAKKQILDKINEKDNQEFMQEFAEKTGIDTSLVGTRGKMTVEILEQELSRVGLTLHETPDCSEIQFVPTIIHDAFKHSGGVSEMIERMISADFRNKIYHN